MIDTPAPVSVPTRSYGRKRKITTDDSNTADENPVQNLSTVLPSPQQSANELPSQEIAPPAAEPMETTYDEQKKVRGGRAKRQFNGSNSSHELKTTASNNNDILPLSFDATSMPTAEHTEKADCSGDGVGGDEFEKPSVKLVISKKKGSIFKSRAIEKEAGESIKQKRHVYKHKWDDDLPEDEKGAAHDA